MRCKVKVECKHLHQALLIYSMKGIFTASEIQGVFRHLFRGHDRDCCK